MILAGGLGTRLSEETVLRPKPMVEIGGKPMLWHIMNIYAHHGFEEFIVALGYKGEVVKDYFLRFPRHEHRPHRGPGQRRHPVHEATSPSGRSTWSTPARKPRPEAGCCACGSGGRGQTFMMTYGDGVADVDIAALVAFHRPTASWPR